LEVTVDNFHVAIVHDGQPPANVPQYEFFMDPSSQTHVSKAQNPYFIRFKSLYEVTWNNSHWIQYQPSFASLTGDWTVSDPTETSTGFAFSMSTGPVISSNKQVQVEKLVFKNFVWKPTAVNNTDCPGKICVKIEVLLKEYNWISPDPNASLALEFWLTGINGVASGQFHQGEHIWMRDGDAYLRASTAAIATPPMIGNISQNLTQLTVKAVQEPNGGLLLFYSHFPTNSSVVHDPDFGIDVNQWPVGLIVAIVLGSGTVIVALVVGLVLWLRRRSKHAEYEQINTTS